MDKATPIWLAPDGLIREHAPRNTKPRQAPNPTNITPMKPHTLMITFLSVAAFAVGCRRDSASQQLDKIQEKTKEAVQDMKDYTFAQKVEFTEKMEGQLVEIHKDLDQLDAKIEKSSDAVKAEIKPKLQALRAREARLNKQLNEVKNATESTWDTVKSGTKEAYDAVQEGFQQSRQWVIAP
jgi:hypothetical protein